MLVWIQSNILEIFVGLCAIAIYFVWRAGQSNTSQFKVREHERIRGSKSKTSKGPLSEARLQRPERLALPGIRLEGAPHEILGVTPHATKAEIMEAYKKLMKQYHPDKVAAPGSTQWNEAQKIASAINAAKEKLLSGLEP